jgi:hypothetical protein
VIQDRSRVLADRTQRAAKAHSQRDALGYSTLDAGLAILPMAAFMVLVAPGSAKLVNRRGSRLTLIAGFAFLLLCFLAMLLLWKQHIPYWKVGLAYALIGIGVGLADTPASHCLTASVPVRRAGMASGTADLQRDLGGAIMQSIFGALLAAGYAAAFTAAIATAPGKQQITTSVQNQLTKSFSSAADAADAAKQYPQYAKQITAAAKTSFLKGDQWAYTAGIIAGYSATRLPSWPAALAPPAELITGVDRLALLPAQITCWGGHHLVINPAFRQQRGLCRRRSRWRGLCPRRASCSLASSRDARGSAALPRHTVMPSAWNGRQPLSQDPQAVVRRACGSAGSSGCTGG